MKVCFDTFGCRLNRAEALAQEAGLAARGWTTTKTHSEADLIIIRGCSVTARAQRDCEKLVEHVRDKYPLKRIIVTGCMKEKRGEQILRDLDLEQVPTSTSRAYLKVQDGCSCACAFCIVPQFRGKGSSVPFKQVLDKAKRMVDFGYSEIVLSGCNLTQYSSDSKRLPELVEALARIDRNCRIRLGSIEPGPVADTLVDVMADNDNICRSLHLPFQSGSQTIVSAMRRPHSLKDAEEVARKAVRLIPHISIGCDLMTGFPGETDLDFMATKMLFKRLPLTRAHIFPYSERPGTTAPSLPNQVPPEVRRERAHELARIADEERTRYAARFVGRKVEIIVEDEDAVAGWTSEYLWCRARHELAKRFRQKRRASVVMKVVRSDGHMLVAEPLG